MNMKAKELSIEDEIRASMEADTTAEPVEVQEPAEEPIEADAPVDTPETPVAEPKPEAPKEAAEPAPTSWSGAVKEKWKDLPPEVRSEIKKREDDMHRMMTAHDGELRLGRSIKEIATPYEAIIRSEGGTVEGAFKDLLNTAYVLRAGTPQQKAQILLQAAQQFNVDLTPYMQQGAQHNPIASLQQEIHALRQQADPNRIKTQLQEDMERDRIKSEIEAFAANPENVHFETVRTAMGSLMSSGRAKNLQEAYEMAIWSEPSIRANLLKAQQEQEAAKRKAEMAAKKKASASVTGSTSNASPSARAPQKSLEDDLRESLMAARGEAL